MTDQPLGPPYIGDRGGAAVYRWGSPSVPVRTDPAPLAPRADFDAIRRRAAARRAKHTTEEDA